MYVFRSKAGTFTIAADPTVSGHYELCIGGMWLGTFESAQLAAENVYRRCTGWHDWDRRGEPECPSGLDEWELLE